MNYLNLLAEKYHHLDNRTRIRMGIAVILLLSLVIILSMANDRIGRLKRQLAAREADVAEMLVLKQRYQQANAVALKLANRMEATRADDSPARIIDEIGIKGKGSQIKPLKGEERGGYQEDVAEVKLDGLSLNEVVNLLFRLERGSRPVMIKKALLKTRYDDPARLDLTLTIALIKTAPQDQR